MNLKYRKTVIAGNWKMNLNAEAAKEFIRQLKPKAVQARWCDVVLCVPFLQIPAAVKAAKGTRIAIGAQNCHYEANGAYTGEISCEMLAEAGVKYVIIGHSERRRDNNETDTTVNRKVLAALQADLRPIICVGESLEMRDNDVTLDVVRMQVKTALRGVMQDQIRRVVIAYEPIWAIGTGYTATAEQAGEVCEAIREVVRQLYGARLARAVSILYGGSMNTANAAELLAQPDVDGGLIGGASLKTESFEDIIEAANQ
ncbi:MAG: triose-phosphate isomerase [Clostridia bacterium]|nr:triose-phosphate isomerase [Clostridia bacterium]